MTPPTKCDRCGRPVVGTRATISIMPLEGPVRKAVLCVDCTIKMKAFIAEGRIERTTELQAFIAEGKR